MALLRGAAWIPLAEVGPLRRCTRTLSQQLLPAGWQMLLRLHFEHAPFPVDATLWYMAPATSLESDDFSEGRMLSCLMDGWVSLGHFPGAREPTVLRLACQYVPALHNVTVLAAHLVSWLYGLASWNKGCVFHRCAAVISAPMTSTGGSTLGPLGPIARWQGPPAPILKPTWLGPLRYI